METSAIEAALEIALIAFSRDKNSGADGAAGSVGTDGRSPESKPVNEPASNSGKLGRLGIEGKVGNAGAEGRSPDNKPVNALASNAGTPGKLGMEGKVGSAGAEGRSPDSKPVNVLASNAGRPGKLGAVGESGRVPTELSAPNTPSTELVNSVINVDKPGEAVDIEFLLCVIDRNVLRMEKLSVRYNTVNSNNTYKIQKTKSHLDQKLTQKIQN